MNEQADTPHVVFGAVFPPEDAYGPPVEGSFGTPETPPAARASVQIRKVAVHEVEVREEMEKSGRFTPDGIAEAMAERLPEARAKLKPAAQQLAYIKEDLAKARSKVRPFDPLRPDDAVAASRQAEIRRYLREVEPAERTRLVMEAEKQGNVEVLRAAVDAPTFLTGVSPEMRERILAKLVEAHAPDELAEVEGLEKQARLLEHALGSAEAILNKLAGEPYDRRAFVEEMSDAEKAQLISEFGGDAYLEAVAS